MAKRPPRKLDQPVPTKPLARVWDMLCNHFFRLLWANFLCSLCCIPIVTIPAALCGLYAVVQQYYRKGYGDVTRTFFHEFRQDFLQRLLISFLVLALPVMAVTIGGVFSPAVSYVAGAIFAVAALLIFGWLFPQLALLRLRPFEALRNAALLTCLENFRNLGLIVVQVFFGAPTILFWPLSFILFLFLLPVAPVIAIHVITEPVLEDRIIGKAKENAN